VGAVGGFVLATDAGGQVLHLHGHWRLAGLAALEAASADLRLDPTQPLSLDCSALEGLDSSGAMLLLRRLAEQGVDWHSVNRHGLQPRFQSLLELVGERMSLARESAPDSRGRHWLPALGQAVTQSGHALRGNLAFIGQTGAALSEALANPRRLRPRELFMQLESVGLEAIAIVSMMTLLIGVVFAYLLALQIEKYGANIFIVDGVAIAICRELAPMLTAILVAGRSGAAFTAQIGAMKVTEEIDAIATLGLSPWHVLVLPRLIAILIAMPLLTFVADLMGLLGSALVAARQLDITFYTFFARLQDVLSLKSVLFGLYKAPAFALAIVLIACRNGFAVARDARSVGEATTRTVVQSLVAVILINAAFALASPVYRGT